MIRKISGLVVISILCLSLLAACNGSSDNNTKDGHIDEFVNDISVVDYGGITYCADKTGLWKVSSNSEKEYLYDDSPAQNLAVNGSIVLFSTYDDGELTSGRYLDSHCAVRQINIDGTAEQKLLDTIDLAKPICIIDKKLYYIDVKNKYSVESLAQTTWLKSYDLDTNEETPIAENAQFAVSSGKHIIYKNMGLSVEQGNMQLHDYDTEAGTEKEISDISAADMKLYGGVLFFTNYSFSESGGSVSVYSYDVEAASEPERRFEYSADSPMIRAYDSEKVYVQSTDYTGDEIVSTNYLADYSTGSFSLIEGLPKDKSFNVAFCDDGALLIDFDTKRSYYYDGNQIYYVGVIVDDGYNFSYHNGMLFANDDDGKLHYASWTFSEDKVQPEPTEKEVDYSSYFGFWEKDYGNYAGASVEFISFDKNVATFKVYSSTKNAARIAETDEITAEIIDNEIQFDYHDSWDNYGSGTITLKEDTIYAYVNPSEMSGGYGVVCDTEMTKR